MYTEANILYITMALFVATKLKDQVITPLNGNPSAGDTVSIMPNNGSGKHIIRVL